MASIITHICISNIVKEELGMSDKFLVGSVLPDLKKLAGMDRDLTHYLRYSVEENGNVMHLPDLDKYLSENTFKLLDFKTLGYYAHLIEDKIWFEKFISKYIKWHDEDLGLVTDLKTGKTYEYSLFKSQIHSDYANIKDVVIKKYNMNMEKIMSQIDENLQDKDLMEYLKKELNDNEKISDKRYFLTNEDLEEYVTMSTKEVIKRINELR